jgi:hypothetical protein
MPDIIHRTIKKNEFRDILMDEPKIPITGQMRDVINITSDEVVDRDDFMAPFQEQIHQM